MKVKTCFWGRWDQRVYTLFLIGSILRLILRLNQHVSGDECAYLATARFIVQNGRFPFMDLNVCFIPVVKPPLYPLICATLYSMFKPFNITFAETLMMFPTVVFGCLTLVLTYQLARDLFNEHVAFYSLLFLAFLPLHVVFSAIGYLEAMYTFFNALAIYLTFKLIRGNETKFVVLIGFVVGLTILSREFGFGLLVQLLLLVIFVEKFRKYWWSLLKASLMGLSIGGWWYIRNYYLLGSPSILMTKLLSSYSEHPTNCVEAYLGFWGDIQLATLLKFQELFDVPYPYFFSSFMTWLAITLILTAFPVIGAFSLLENKRAYKDQIVTLLPWVLLYLPLPIIYEGPHAYYIAVITPAFVILSSLGFDRLRMQVNKRLRRDQSLNKLLNLQVKAQHLIIIILITLLIPIFIHTHLSRTRFEFYYGDSIIWVKENTPSDAIILAAGHWRAYYTNRSYVWFREDYPVWSILKYPSILELEGKDVYNIAVILSIKYNVSFVWVDHYWELKEKSFPLAKSIPYRIENSSYFTLVYADTLTSTRIYKIKLK